MRIFLQSIRFGACPTAILLGALAVLASCRSYSPQPTPSVRIVRVPRAGSGGPEGVESISGTATTTAAGQQIVLYARNGGWWVQPFRSRPFTRVESDLRWKNVTHAGLEYAALLVKTKGTPSSRDLNPKDPNLLR